uniref:Uma2 family endonuclease n=1 Tax=uncultured Sphingomonas sp. TaxID=158754 RepID=UPI0035CC5B3E
MNKPVRLVAESVPETAFTVRDYMRMHDAGAFSDMKVELVRGELRKMMSGGFSHGEMNGKLVARLITAYAGTDHRLAVDLMVGIDALTVLGADIAVVVPDVPEKGPVPPDRFVLIVEIAVTTLGKDLGEKLADYARAGVPEYWVADVDAQVMHVMRSPDGDRYTKRSVVPFDQPLAVPGTSETIRVA